MPKQASVYRVLVASPGDCTHERQLIPQVIDDWNAAHSADESAIIECVKWETHTYPSLLGRPQEIINKQIAEECDFLIGTFWTKLGTPTGVAQSGTLEEIELFVSSNKPVMLYFSSVEVKLEDVKIEQYQALTAYKKSLQAKGLYFDYNSLQDLKEKLSRHLSAVMIELLRGKGGKAQEATVPIHGKETTSSSENKSPTSVVSTQELEEEQLTVMPYGDSIGLFAHRVGKAFPGIRGIAWFNDPESATERLMLLLKKPLKFKSSNDELGGHHSPIWWFRAGSSMMIEKVSILSPTKILMDGEELSIKRVAVFESARWYQCFVYVEVQAEEQTGLYNYSSDDIEDQRKALGYADEEYALFNGRPIKRTEYDDGAAVIDGKVVDIFGAELRTRYLTDYNFIICAQDAPFNSTKFDRDSEDFLDGILAGTSTTESFFDWMKTFRKYED